MSLPKRIILLRHGRSQSQEDDRILERVQDHKIPLTTVGFIQAREAGQTLCNLIGKESFQIYCSPFLRARQTAIEIISKFKERDLLPRRIYEDPRLREQEWGHLRPRKEVAKIQEERYAYGPFYYRFPDGESCADVYDRISTFLESMYRDFSDPTCAENAIVVCHGMTLRVFLMRWFHNCAPHIMELNGKRYELKTKLQTISK
jgi:broad specificity phosphatase PhoE